MDIKIYWINSKTAPHRSRRGCHDATNVEWRSYEWSVPERRKPETHASLFGHNEDSRDPQESDLQDADQASVRPNKILVMFNMLFWKECNPLVTSYSSSHVLRQPYNRRRQYSQVNRRIRRYRVFIEHVIHLFKIFRVIGTLYRHRITHLSQIVLLCGCLAIRITKLFFQW